jgi:hypothetical protein
VSRSDRLQSRTTVSRTSSLTAKTLEMHDPEALTAVKMKMLVFWVVTVNLQVDTGVSEKLTASILSPEVRTTSQARTTPLSSPP